MKKCSIYLFRLVSLSIAKDFGSFVLYTQTYEHKNTHTHKRAHTMNKWPPFGIYAERVILFKIGSNHLAQFWIIKSNSGSYMYFHWALAFDPANDTFENLFRGSKIICILWCECARRNKSKSNAKQCKMVFSPFFFFFFYFQLL